MRSSLRVASALLLLLCIGCGDSGSKPPPSTAAPPAPSATRLRVQLNWFPEPEFGGLYAADLGGFFKEEGLEVELIKGGPSVAAPQLAASGSVEFAVVAGEQILTLREAGGELVGVFATYQSDPMGVMVHAESPFQSIEELWRSDAKVACETNLSFIVMLNARYGGTKLSFVPYQGSVAQFVADPALAQQCFITAEPVTLERQGVKVRVFPSSASGFDPYNAVIATRSSYAKEHAAEIAKLVRALQRGWQEYLRSPGATNAVMSGLNPSMTKEAMDAAAARQAPLIRTAETDRLGLGAMTAERWTKVANQLKELGKIKKAPADANELFTWSGAKDAR